MLYQPDETEKNLQGRSVILDAICKGDNQTHYNFDLFGEKKTIYHVKRVLNETGTNVENGFYEIYTNTEVDDGSDIAELMQFFKNSTGYHEKFPHLSNRVNLFKETEEGVRLMSEVIEKIKAEGREEGKLLGRREGKRLGRKEGTYRSAQILVNKGLAKTEKEACKILNADYHKFLNWKRNNA